MVAGCGRVTRRPTRAVMAPPPPPLCPQVVRVGLPELRRLMLSGDMLLPSVATCYLALERLEARQQRHEGGSGMQQQQQQQQQQQRQQQQQPEGGQG